MSPAEELVAKANQQLKAARVGVTLEIQGKGNWLYVRGTFPPKPGETRAAPRQTRIALKIKAIDSKSVEQARLIALQIGLDLNNKTFDWKKFSNVKDPADKTVRDWVEEYQAQFWREREMNSASINTWKKGYISCLRKLPPDAKLTTELLLEWITDNSTPKTRRRGHYLTCAKGLSELAGLPVSAFNKLKGASGNKAVNPRHLPTDAEIVEIRNSISDPGWQYVYGMLATYGLRNHEVFYLDYSRFPIVVPPPTTKTGERLCKPLYPEWAELWNLKEIIYPEKLCISPDLSNSSLGSKITDWFNNRIPHTPYALRHAWARRAVEFGVPPDVAAHLMGHSLTTHLVSYRAWIGDDVYLNSFDRAVDKSELKAPE